MERMTQSFGEQLDGHGHKGFTEAFIEKRNYFASGMMRDEISETDGRQTDENVIKRIENVPFLEITVQDGAEEDINAQNEEGYWYG